MRCYNNHNNNAFLLAESNYNVNILFELYFHIFHNLFFKLHYCHIVSYIQYVKVSEMLLHVYTRLNNFD